MSKSGKAGLAVTGFLVASILTVVVLFKSAESREIAWTNDRLSDLKQQGSEYLDLEDEKVKAVLASGSEKGSEQYLASAKWGAGCVGFTQ